MKDAEAKVEPVSKPGPVRCWSIHHEEQGYRESMEDVVLALMSFHWACKKIQQKQYRQ